MPRPAWRGRVRIIGGEWRGRKLRVPRSGAARPTPDRVRETLFNWLAADLPGAPCLDLFAGTGALGFEALSRGARFTQFVERDPGLAKLIDEHIAMLGANAELATMDAVGWLARPPREAYDIVFLDPPYAMPIEPVVAALRPWLSADAVVYVERLAADGLPALPGFRWRRDARAGDVAYGLATPIRHRDSVPAIRCR